MNWDKCKRIDTDVWTPPPPTRQEEVKQLQQELAELEIRKAEIVARLTEIMY